MTTPTRDLQPATWWLEPRDPLVFGDGGRVPALMPRSAVALPPQATVAGLVRTAFLEAAGDFSPESIQRVLGVRIRGPWLVKADADADQLWVPAPADLALAGGELLRPKLLKLREAEGVSWPGSAPPAMVHLPSRGTGAVGERATSNAGVKTEALPFPYWPLDAVIDWGLGADPVPRLQPHRLLERSDVLPIQRESRVHVAIDPETQAALAEALFSSGGLRVDDGFRFALEVSIPPGEPLRVPALSGLKVLGGESRTVACSDSKEPLLPRAESYEDRVTNYLRAKPGELCLRVQLLTPGSFGGWVPRWPAGVGAPLLAVALDRHLAVSGWNLAAGKQRAVRRLVPAGTVYYLGPFNDRAALLETWRLLWGASLSEGDPGDPATFLAPPAHDGYGIALPLPCSLEWEDS